jgi:hypothetical protein
MSNGCKISPRSLRNDFAGHLRMNGAEVGIRSRFAESERKLFVGVEHLGFEGLRIIAADNGVGNIVPVRPSNGSPNRHGQTCRSEAEVVNLYFDSGSFVLRDRDRALFAYAESRNPQHQNYRQTCYTHASPHRFFLSVYS